MDIPRGGYSWPVFLGRIEIWNVVFFPRDETVVPGEKPSEQGREPKKNSTHMWRQVWESNPG